jgi:N-acetylneuraminate synthase
MTKAAAVVAELACNHNGMIETAEEMIDEASIHGAFAVKLQKRDLKTWALHKPDVYLAPHPNPKNSYGTTYLEHREFLEFDIDQHKYLKGYAENKGVAYISSVFDLPSAKQIAKLNPIAIKIPSAANNNYEMLEWLAENYSGEIHVSSGMTTRAELEEAVSVLSSRKRLQDTVLYHCVSGYPVPYDKIYLPEIVDLKKRYGSELKAVGFSGHHHGIVPDLVAFSLGATVIERHFTLDRNMKGTDHIASLEPEELGRLVDGLNVVDEALLNKPAQILDIEKDNRKKLKW